MEALQVKRFFMFLGYLHIFQHKGRNVTSFSGDSLPLLCITHLLTVQLFRQRQKNTFTGKGHPLLKPLHLTCFQGLFGVFLPQLYLPFLLLMLTLKSYTIL